MSSYLLLIFWALLDYFVTFQPGYRKTYFFVVFAGILVFIFEFILSNKKYLNDYSLILYIQKEIPELKDELINAWQLFYSRPQGVSTELISKLVEDVEKDIKNISPLKAARLKSNLFKPFRYLLITLFLTAFLFLIPPYILRTPVKRILSSMSTNKWQTWFDAAPGTKSYPHGSAVKITVTGKQSINSKPFFYVRSKGASWQRPEPEKSGVKNEYFYQIEKLTGVLEYFISWADIDTEVFSLTPVMTPQLGEFNITLKYPEYTGLPVFEIKGNPNISALRGTVVDLNAKTSKRLKKAALILDGKRYPVNMEKDRIFARFKVSKECSYSFFLEAEDSSIDPEPPQYFVATTEDRQPRVELVSPNTDLVIADNSEIPLIFNASDDFLVSKITLNYKIDKAEGSRVEINKNEAKTFQDTYEYRWAVSALNLKPSQKVYYYLEVWDNDTVTGPKSGVSQAYSLEITNYVKEHENIEASLKEFKNELLKILADQTVAKDKTESLSTKYSTSTYNSVTNLQKAVRDNMQVPLTMLEKLLSRMETDPYTDSSTYSEYKGLKSHLESIKDNPMAKAISAVEKKDWKETKTNQDEIIAGLEKLSLLAEDVWQYQKMRDLVDAGAQMDKAGQELIDKLSNPAKPEDIKNSLDNIRELLEKIAKQLTKLPKELPEDFVNAPAIKNIDLKSSQDLLTELSDAIAKGDWEKARSLAKELKEQLSSMLKNLNDVGKDIGFSSSMAEQMNNRLEKYSSKLKGVIEDQKGLNKKIESMDGIRQKSLFKKQEDLLKALAARQRAVVVRSEKVSQKAKQYLWKFDETLNLMKKTSAEFDQSRVYHSQKYLENIVIDLVSLKRVTAPDAALPANTEFCGDITFITNEEQDILEILKRSVQEDIFSQQDKEKLKSLSDEEGKISDKTKDLRHSLEEFSRNSSSIDPQTYENMYGAQKQMEKAGGELSALDTSNAIDSGYKALEYLETSQNALESSRENLLKQGKSAGRPVSSPIQIRTKGGMTGWYSVPVKLPGIDEYKPPREFRQEIIDALKEKYPLQYEKIIKEYYRRLTQ